MVDGLLDEGQGDVDPFDLSAEGFGGKHERVVRRQVIYVVLLLSCYHGQWVHKLLPALGVGRQERGLRRHESQQLVLVGGIYDNVVVRVCQYHFLLSFQDQSCHSLVVLVEQLTALCQLFILDRRLLKSAISGLLRWVFNTVADVPAIYRYRELLFIRKADHCGLVWEFLLYENLQLLERRALHLPHLAQCN